MKPEVGPMRKCQRSCRRLDAALVGTGLILWLTGTACRARGSQQDLQRSTHDLALDRILAVAEVDLSCI